MMSHENKPENPTFRSNQIPWIFFDFFGTTYLMRPTPSIFVKQTLEKLGLPIPTQVSKFIETAGVADHFVHRILSQHDSMSLDHIFQLPGWQPYLKRLQSFGNFDVESTQRIFHQWHEYWATPGDQIVPCHGLSETLQKLDERGFHLGMVSNTEWDLRKILVRDQIDHFFKFVITSGEVGVQKPDPQLFHYAMAKAQVSPTQCALIGDSLNTDIKGAQAVGWYPIFLHRPNRRITGKIPGNVLVVNSFRDLVHIFL